VTLAEGRVTPEVRHQIDECSRATNTPDEPDWLARRIVYKYRSTQLSREEVPVFLKTDIEKGFPHEGYIDFVETQLTASTGR